MRESLAKKRTLKYEVIQRSPCPGFELYFCFQGLIATAFEKALEHQKAFVMASRVKELMGADYSDERLDIRTAKE